MQSMKMLLRARQEKLEEKMAVQTFWDRLRDGARRDVRQDPVSPEEVERFRKILRIEGCSHKKYSDMEIKYMITIGTPLNFLREEDYKAGILDERADRWEKREKMLPVIQGPHEIMVMGLDGGLATR